MWTVNFKQPIWIQKGGKQERVFRTRFPQQPCTALLNGGLACRSKSIFYAEGTVGVAHMQLSRSDGAMQWIQAHPSREHPPKCQRSSSTKQSSEAHSRPKICCPRPEIHQGRSSTVSRIWNLLSGDFHPMSTPFSKAYCICTCYSWTSAEYGCLS